MLKIDTFPKFQHIYKYRYILTEGEKMMEHNKLFNLRINDQLLEVARIRAAEKAGEIKKILTLSGYIRELILEDSSRKKK